MTILIADISNNQGPNINVGVLARVVDGVYHKATEGSGFTDAYFNERRGAALEAGLPFGAYHFAHPDTDPVAQALHFCATVKQLGPHDLRPVLDLETGNPATAEDWVHRFDGVVRDKLGCWPVFYSYPDYIARMRLSKPVGDGLWLASYGRNDGADHPYFTPAPFKKSVLHQFTSVGKLSGVPMRVDLSHGESLRPLLAHPIWARAF